MVGPEGPLAAPMSFSGRSGPPGVDTQQPERKKPKQVKKPPSVRSEFPETWLWTEEVVR